jgi:parallel beta-helix repeat protein
MSSNTVYWFAPGLHYNGNSSSAWAINTDEITNSAFVGGTGATWTGYDVANAAIGGTPGGSSLAGTDITVEYLTLENFDTPNGQNAVNHDEGANWTIKYDTVTGTTEPGTTGEQLGGAAVGMGSGDVIEYNCLTHNGEYGLNGGGTGVTVADNEISWNGAAMFPDMSGCGCSGGAKFWAATNFTIENNYVHDNYNVGLWIDTDDAGFLISGNYIANNWAEGIIYEISYNADITGNTFLDNGWGVGSYSAGGFPYGDAIYVSSSGGDPNVDSNYRGVFEVTDNTFTDNWDGVIVYQNPNRLCGSTANSSSGYCTLDNPSVYTLASCPANDGSGSPSESPNYFDNCQWKADNITVSGNTFNFNPSDIANATPPLPDETLSNCPTSNLTNTSSNSYWCGYNGMFSFFGSGSGGPSVGWSDANAIMNLSNSSGEVPDNNHWSDNTYTGTWAFNAYGQGGGTQNGYSCSLTFSGWQADWGQDSGSTYS